MYPKYVTLEEILKEFRSSLYLDIISRLTTVSNIYDKLNDNQRNKQLNEKSRANSKLSLNNCLNDCIKLELFVSASLLKTFIRELGNPQLTNGEFGISCISLKKCLTNEMNLRLYFSIEPNKKPLLEPQPFGNDVDYAFPSARIDIEEASKCLAFSRGSACVFHLMKALEVALYALAQDLNIQKIEENWGNALDQIKSSIDQLKITKPNKKTASENEQNSWNELFEFYNDCLTHYRYIKDAWRNSNTHTRKGSESYSEEKAEQIYDNVRGFMQTMALRLNEIPL